MRNYTKICLILCLFLSRHLATCCVAQPLAIRAVHGLHSLQEIKFASMVAQGFDWSCGVASLATLLREGFGDSITEMDLIDRVNKYVTSSALKEQGLSMQQLLETAEGLGYVAIAKNLTLKELADINLPVIIKIDHFDDGHFVVFKGVVHTPRLSYAIIVDPADGNRRVPIYQIEKEWLGKESRSPVLIIQRRDSLWLDKSSLIIN